MCGVIGMVSSEPSGFNQSNIKIFNNLLWVNTLRGNDSTGVFGVNKHGNVDFLKTVGSAHNMLSSDEYKDFKSEMYSDYQMVVGHNRAATRGMITDENAHPFIEDTTILVHNGTLINHGKLTKEVVEVDSHAILHSIVERGYEDTLKDIEGAFTLAWYDTKDKTLRVIRNNERPLFIASTVGAWYFASEKEMLELVLGREQVDIADMTECKPGVMYYWELEDKKNMWYKPYPLWSPPKNTTTNMIPFVKKETKVLDQEPQSTSGYANSDFIMGTKLLFSIDHVNTFKKVNDQGYSDLLLGNWYFDDNVKVRIWASPAEASILDFDDDAETLIVQAEITCVISKKGTITLVCNKPTEYAPELDSNQNEIYRDEFMFTNMQCDDCKKPMTFESLKHGVFKYKSIIDYECLCEKCK